MRQTGASGMAVDLMAVLLAPAARGEVRDLAGAVFEEPVDLSGCRIGNVDLSRAIFAAPVVARGAVFNGLAWLRGAVFKSSVDFSSAIFCSDARFDSAVFTGETNFS